MIGKRYYCLFICLFICLTTIGQTITDSQFFDAIDLNYDGLQSVKRAVLSKDYSKAKREYVYYLKTRKTPVWSFDWKASDAVKRHTSVNIQEADRYVNNELVSCGIWHQFGAKIYWTLNPTRNQYKEWTWQLNRHYFWISLGKAYWNSGDEKYAKAFVSQLNSWIDQCERPKDDGNYPGSPWRTLEAGLRMRYSWPYAFYYFLSSPSFDDESVFRMVKSFYEHALFLYDNSISDYRLSHEMNGLFVVGTLFPELREAENWKQLAVEKLYAEEVEQFYPDGAQKELAPSYHGTNSSCIVSVYQLAQLNHYQLPVNYVKRLESIYEFYEKLIMPDGKLPAVNDSRWFESKNSLSTAAELFDDRKDFSYLATRGEKGEKPSFTSVWMPWAGWYVMRSGWDANDFYALFEVGPYGTGHQHEDKLSFVLCAYGSVLITECGNYAYDNSQWRKYAISARGHNVVRIDGKDQNRFSVKNEKGVCESSAPLDNKWISKRKYEEGEGHYTEGFGEKSDNSVTHHRTLRFVKNKYWLLTDEFIPSDDKEHTYDNWFHFNTDRYLIDSLNNIIYSNDPLNANIAIINLGEDQDMNIVVGAETPEVQGWVSEGSSDEGFSVRPVATPVFHSKGTGIVKEYYVFIPLPQGVSAGIKKVKHPSSHKYRIYMEDGAKYTIRL